MSTLNRLPYLVVCLSMLIGSLTLSSRAGWIENRDGKTIIHLKLFNIPDPTRTDTKSRADYAVLKRFYERFPEIFKERYAEEYKANPEEFGDYNWDDVEIELHKFSGISVEGQSMDSGPLMAIAGGVSPDIIYVNFRQSDTYIQQGFLYPLDKPEDNYMKGPRGLTEEEMAFQIHPKTMPVIKRKGPGGDVQVWAKPYGGVLGKVMLYRKDLLKASGVPIPHNNWTWDDLYWACRKIANPAKGTYGIAFGKGKSESWFWVTFLWSAGGEALAYNQETDEWTAAYDSRGAAEAVNFYTTLNSEIWYDAEGKRRYGYAAMEADETRKWSLGQIGFMTSYIDEKLFSTINPDLVGMVPVPIGPGGNRGAELNSRMQGIFSGVESPVIRDAAWEYLRFIDSKEAVKISTQMMVEGGLGRFVNPRYLEMFGYHDLVRLAPKGWVEIFDIAIETGKPEPYGRNSQFVYEFMTDPLVDARAKMRADEVPTADPTAIKEVIAAATALVSDGTEVELMTEVLKDLEFSLGRDMNTASLRGALKKMDDHLAGNENADIAAVRDSLQAALDAMKEERLDEFQSNLKGSVAVANEKMIGRLTDKQKATRRSVAAVLLLAIFVSFGFLFRKIFKAFTPPEVVGADKQVKWGFRKYAPAYLIILPAVLSILVWQYIPLVIGSAMAFQDYQILGESKWVGIDNFANIMWDGAWWASVWNAFRYSLLVIGLTFLPPVILAVLLDEIPQGKILFRTIFYLPAVITGLVVIYLWRSFYEGNEYGALNRIVLAIPAIGYILLGVMFFVIMYFFARRLWIHQSYWQSVLCFIVGVILFLFCYRFTDKIYERVEEVSRFTPLIWFPIFLVIGAVHAGATYGIWLGIRKALGFTPGAKSSIFAGAAFTLCSIGLFVYYVFMLGKPGPDLETITGFQALFLNQPEPYGWLDDRSTAMLCCVIPMVWAGMGPGCLIYLAALKGIAPDFYEAADIDGATFIDKILFVVVPILKPLLVINFVGVFIGAWKSSAFILAMTGGGSGTEVAGLHIFYKAYLHLKFGPAAAMAWILGFMLIGFTVHQLRILSRLEFKTTGGDK